MEHGTKQDYELLAPAYLEHAKGELVDNLVRLLGSLKGPKLGYQIDRYDHSLQSATRALRAGESVDVVVGALLHDVGDSIAPENHSALAASLLRPYVDDTTHWVIEHHGLFQGYYYFHHLAGDRHARDAYADHPAYADCVRFCAEYDQNCFDPDYENLPLEDFMPMLEDVFSRPSRVPGVPPVGFTEEAILP